MTWRKLLRDRFIDVRDAIDAGEMDPRADRRRHQAVHAGDAARARVPLSPGNPGCARDDRCRTALLRRVHVNILLLTSEFAPAMGGIGTYARRDRVRRHAPRCAGDGGGSGLRTDDRGRRQRPCPSRSSAFAAACIRCGICRPRSCWRAARFAAVATTWFTPPTGRSSFRVALSRWRTQARMLMTVHGTEINETQTPLKRLAIRGAGVFGPRTQVVANSRYTESLFRERFAVEARRVSAVRLGRIGFLVRRAQDDAPRFVRHIGWRPTGSSSSRWRGSRVARDTISRLPRWRAFPMICASASPGW